MSAGDSGNPSACGGFDDGQKAIMRNMGFEIGEAIYARHANERSQELELLASRIRTATGETVDEAITEHQDECVKPDTAARRVVARHVSACPAPKIASRLRLWGIVLICSTVSLLVGAGLLEGGVIRQLWSIVFSH